MTDERLLQEISAAVNLASLSEKVGEPMDLRLRLYSLAIAYADARESKEIAELKAENARLWTDFYKIKFELETAESEINRLREGVQKEIDIQTELRETGINTGQVFDSVLKVRRCVVDALELLLSPAPVKETQNEDQYE